MTSSPKLCARCGRWRLGKRCAHCRRQRRKANKAARTQREATR